MLRPWHHTLILDKSSAQTIHQQLIQHFFRMIHHGEWLADSALPSTREIAKQLGINRKTVARVYEELLAQGLIYTQAKRGTFVAKLGATEEPTQPLLTETCPITPLTEETQTIQALIQSLVLRHTRRAALHVPKLQSGDYDQGGLHSLRQMLASQLAHEKKMLIAPQQLACSTWPVLEHRLLRMFKERDGAIFTDDAQIHAWLQQQGVTVYTSQCLPDALITQIEKYCINYPVNTLWLSADTLKLATQAKLAQCILDYRLLLIEDLRLHAGQDSSTYALASRLPEQTIVLGSLYGNYCDMFNLYYLTAPAALVATLLNPIDRQQQQSLLLNMLAQTELLKRGDYKKLMHRITQLQIAKSGCNHPR